MKMDRKHLLIFAAVALVALFVFVKWYEKRKSEGTGADGYPATGQGANLNSIAPELVGGSTGPSIGPALSVPIDITVTATNPASSANPVGNLAPITPTASNAMQPGIWPPDQRVMNPILRSNPDNPLTGAQVNSPTGGSS